MLISSKLFAKDPSALINEIVDEAAVLSSEDPVEAKIIKLNEIRKSVDIRYWNVYFDIEKIS